MKPIDLITCIAGTGLALLLAFTPPDVAAADPKPIGHCILADGGGQ